jgi:hypothetical protein
MNILGFAAVEKRNLSGWNGQFHPTLLEFARRKSFE